MKRMLVQSLLLAAVFVAVTLFGGQFQQEVFDIGDLSGVDVKEGEVVTLIGKDGEENISVEELAELAGTFNYEFVCDLGKRIPRVYYRNGKIVCMKDYFIDEYEII